MSTVTGPGLRVLGIDPGLQTTGYAIVEPGERGPRVREAGIIRS
jgi:crossover junction endodeoxyribonuclease RuvC